MFLVPPQCGGGGGYKLAGTDRLSAS